MLRIETVYQTKNRCYQAAKPARHIGILVHSTGAVNKSLKRYVDAPELAGVNQYGNHWNSPKSDKCMHAFIGLDKDGEIMAIETLPYPYACWGCGKGDKGSYNYDPTAHIQFEICQGSDTDEAYYRKAIRAAEEYCAYLCRLFGFTEADITSHREAAQKGYASGHDDPVSWMKHFGDDMDKFRTRVGAMLRETGKEERMVKFRVTGTRLALRKEPTTSAPVIKKSGEDVRMDTGTEITGEAVNTEWARVTYGGVTGYSMLKHLQVVQPVHPQPPTVETPPVAEMTDKEKLDRLWEWYLTQKEAGG